MMPNGAAMHPYKFLKVNIKRSMSSQVTMGVSSDCAHIFLTNGIVRLLEILNIDAIG